MSYSTYICTHSSRVFCLCVTIRNWMDTELVHLWLDGVWGEPEEGQASLYGPLRGVRQGQNSSLPSWGGGRRIYSKVSGEEETNRRRGSQQGFFSTTLLLLFLWFHVRSRCSFLVAHVYVGSKLCLSGHQDLSALTWLIKKKKRKYYTRSKGENNLCVCRQMKRRPPTRHA